MKILPLIFLALPLLAMEGTPTEWRSVRTNEIVRWKADHKAPSGVFIDKNARSVVFLAEATGVEPGESIEFLVIGPLSDRAYESFAVSVASPEDIVSAAEAVGLPRGLCVNNRSSRLYPMGEGVNVSLRTLGGKNMALADVVKDSGNDHILESPVIWTGGERDVRGTVVASTNIPCAVFALYNHAPSALQLDGAFDQSSTYGRFQAGAAFAAGDLVEVKMSWSGNRRVLSTNVLVNASSSLPELVRGLKGVSAGHDIHAVLSFADNVSLAKAAESARVFEMLDGSAMKMNGSAPGQFFYRAFLPDEKWRERVGRIFQPFEARVSSDGKNIFTFVEEDWSGEGDDPILKPRDTPFLDWCEVPGLIAACGEQGKKVDVMFIYASHDTPIGKLRGAVEALKEKISTFYIFTLDFEPKK